MWLPPPTHYILAKQLNDHVNGDWIDEVLHHNVEDGRAGFGAADGAGNAAGVLQVLARAVVRASETKNK